MFSRIYWIFRYLCYEQLIWRKDQSVSVSLLSEATKISIEHIKVMTSFDVNVVEDHCFVPQMTFVLINLITFVIKKFKIKLKNI